jgi:hypothetical protein
MCKRSEKDPLVRILTDRYRLNILRHPRSNVGVGELLILEEGDLKCSGNIKRLFRPELEISQDSIVPLADLGGVLSRHVSTEIAARPLMGLLFAMGVNGLSSIGGVLKKARDVSIAFGLSEVEYRSTDLVALGGELENRVLRERNALYQPGRQYFIAHAVARAKGIKVAFDSAGKAAANLALEVAELINAEYSLEVSKGDRGYLVISGRAPVTFGLAVVQLDLDGEIFRLASVERLRAVRSENARGDVAESEPDVLFGGPDGDVFVEVAE